MQATRQAFAEEGIVPASAASQELAHITVLSSRLMSSSMAADENTDVRNRTVDIDASHMLAKHADLDWGRFAVNDVHLSERGRLDICDNAQSGSGYYHCVSRARVSVNSQQ